MDMLGGSPQSDCYLTEEVYTILPHFRSGFRLCNATIPDLPGVSIARLEGERSKRDTFLEGFGVARFSDLGLVRGQLCIYCLPAMAVRDGLFIGRRAPKRPKSAIADLGGGQPPQSALLESRSAFGRKAVLRALCGGPSFSGGGDQRRRTRVAGATGALAAGAPRPRCRDLRLAAVAGFRSAAGSAVEEAQAPPARPHFLYRGPAHPRHYCLSARVRVNAQIRGRTNPIYFAGSRSVASSAPTIVPVNPPASTAATVMSA